MKIATIKGIEIKMHLSTLAILGIVGYYAANYYFIITGVLDIISLIIVGIINGLLMLISILVHELMHSLVAQRHGLKVNEIDFYIFGGVSNIEEEPKNPKSEIYISIVGPLSSLGIGGFFLAFFFIFQLGFEIMLPAILLVTLLYMGYSNLALGLFNLLPAFPMDGGRVLRAYLWKKRENILSATKTASQVGKYFGYALIGYGFFQIIFTGLTNGFWLLIIGMFLISSTKQAYNQVLYEVKLSKLDAKDIRRLPDITIPPAITLDKAIKNYFMKYKKSYFPVSENSNILGMINIENIKEVSNKKRSEIKIEDIMHKVDEYPIISEEDTGKKALKKLQQSNIEPQLVMVHSKENDKIVGVIGQDEILAALRVSDLFFQEI